MLSSQARMCNAFHSFHVKISTLSTLSGKKTSNFYVNSKHVPVYRKKKREWKKGIIYIYIYITYTQYICTNFIELAKKSFSLFQKKFDASFMQVISFLLFYFHNLLIIKYIVNIYKYIIYYAIYNYVFIVNNYILLLILH